MCPLVVSLLSDLPHQTEAFHGRHSAPTSSESPQDTSGYWTERYQYNNCSCFTCARSQAEQGSNIIYTGRIILALLRLRGRE